MEINSALLASGITFVLTFGLWVLARKFGRDNIDKAVATIDIYLEAAWQAMLYVEQTLKKQPGMNDDTLKDAAVDFAVDFLHSIGLKNITDEDVEMIAGLIEAALREFKGRARETSPIE